jgi:uncharacterized protein (DUF1697 family)
MTVYLALLRAVNVGGTGKLPMEHLREMCEAAGFKGVRTYIASGNVIFESDKTEAEVKAVLEASLRAYVGKPVGVLVRTAKELAQVLAGDPFSKAPRNKTVTIFLDKPPPKDVLKTMSGQGEEEVALGKREVYVHYPDGIGKSKLRIRAAGAGTARNMNTVAKLVEMAKKT